MWANRFLNFMNCVIRTVDKAIAYKEITKFLILKTKIIPIISEFVASTFIRNNVFPYHLVITKVNTNYFFNKQLIQKTID